MSPESSRGSSSIGVSSQVPRPPYAAECPRILEGPGRKLLEEFKKGLHRTVEWHVEKSEMYGGYDCRDRKEVRQVLISDRLFARNMILSLIAQVAPLLAGAATIFLRRVGA
jgi:hypothetical protein